MSFSSIQMPLHFLFLFVHLAYFLARQHTCTARAPLKITESVPHCQLEGETNGDTINSAYKIVVPFEIGVVSFPSRSRTVMCEFFESN